MYTSGSTSSSVNSLTTVATWYDFVRDMSMLYSSPSSNGRTDSSDADGVEQTEMGDADGVATESDADGVNEFGMHENEDADGVNEDGVATESDADGVNEDAMLENEDADGVNEDGMAAFASLRRMLWRRAIVRIALVAALMCCCMRRLMQRSVLRRLT